MYHLENIQTGPKVLIVDDHLDNLNLMQLHLSSRGYNVEIAVNGYDALEKLEQNSVDLIITDINMPGMDGNDLCRIVRESPEDTQLPIIAISAEPWLATTDFTYVVAKPFRINDIVLAIRETLGSSEEVISLQERRQQI